MERGKETAVAYEVQNKFCKQQTFFEKRLFWTNLACQIQLSDVKNVLWMSQFLGMKVVEVCDKRCQAVKNKEENVTKQSLAIWPHVYRYCRGTKKIYKPYEVIMENLI